MAVYLAKYGIAGREDHQHHIPVSRIGADQRRDLPVRKKLYDIEEIAEVLNVGRTKVFDLIRTGQLASVKSAAVAGSPGRQ